MAKFRNFDSFGGCIPTFSSFPIDVKFGAFGAAPPCQILRLSGQKCGNTAPKTVPGPHPHAKFRYCDLKNVHFRPKNRQKW